MSEQDNNFRFAAMREQQRRANAHPKLRAALIAAEGALADIGDTNRSAGDDIAWCERRATAALPTIRAAISTANEGAAP